MDMKLKTQAQKPFKFIRQLEAVKSCPKQLKPGLDSTQACFFKLFRKKTKHEKTQGLEKTQGNSSPKLNKAVVIFCEFF